MTHKYIPLHVYCFNHRPLLEKQANLYVLGEHLKQERKKKEKLKRFLHALKTPHAHMFVFFI